MEDVPPSYDSAVDREVWKIVAPWIPSSDLCSACLVSQKWHSIFIRFLWGDPASHFGQENDAVYVALTRFKRTLKKARATVRQLTHTLQLPPALSEIYGGPNPTWLRDVLEYLPNLQSLIVSRLPFFDHHSLRALRHSSTSRRLAVDDSEDEIPLYGLKLLLAVREPNSTSASLAEALRHFPQLVYLDLSYTTPAKDASVLAALSNLYDLQVLKLRGVGLRDGEAEVLANAIGTRVRLLDVSENYLTDMAVRSLLQACFFPAEHHPSTRRANGRQVDDWPAGLAPGPDFLSLDTLRSDQLDQELLKQLMNPLTGRLAFEDIPHRGLTHLYIADNHLSVEGLASLLKTTRLHVLDGGTVDTVKIIARRISLSSPTGYRDEISFPGAEKLIPILSTYAGSNLTYLRLDHAVVTQKLPLRDAPSPTSSAAELPTPIMSAAELPPEERLVFEAPAAAHYPVEMPSEREPVYELPADAASPKYELPGDCIHFALSPPVGDAPVPSRTPSQARLPPVKGDGVFAPEVVVRGNGLRDGEGSSDDEGVVLDASGTGRTARHRRGPPEGTLVTAAADISPASPHPATTPPGPRPLPPLPSTLRLARIDNILRKRPVGMATKAEPSVSTTGATALQIPEFHPSALPHLRTLVLTNVPASVPQSSPVLPALRNLIAACADEAQLALLRAKTNYSLPPGRSRQAAEIHHARSLFALGLIVLEIAPPQLEGKHNTARAGPGKGWQHLRQRLSLSKSSTGDPDSETFWSAAENDFSFFGEEGEEQDECGIYQHDPDKYFPTTHLDDKIVVSHDDLRNGAGPPPASPHGSFRSLESGSALLRSPTVLQSPRNLPLGRNRRSSSSTSGRDRESIMAEMAGSIPTSNPVAKPQTPVKPDEPLLDVVAELAKFRREKKAEHDAALLRWRLANNPHRPVAGPDVDGGGGGGGTVTDDKDLPFTDGHWKGEIKVVRNVAPKGRTGVVDVYGNYFEKGYLYP